jgi:hypothetical protein
MCKSILQSELAAMYKCVLGVIHVGVNGVVYMPCSMDELSIKPLLVHWFKALSSLTLQAALGRGILCSMKQCKQMPSWLKIASRHGALSFVGL